MQGAYGGVMVALDVDRRLSALARLTAEYHDLPGLRLTAAQAARLCGLSISEAETVLTALMISGYLYCDRSGQYATTFSCSREEAVVCAECGATPWYTTH